MQAKCLSVSRCPALSPRQLVGCAVAREAQSLSNYGMSHSYARAGLPAAAREWIPTTLGLASIPAIIHPIDAAVDGAMDVARPSLERSPHLGCRAEALTIRPVFTPSNLHYKYP